MKSTTKPPDSDGMTWRKADASEVEFFARQQLDGWFSASLHVACCCLGYSDEEARALLNPTLEIFVNKLTATIQRDMLATMDEPEHLT
jgi:hypothetical protein